MLGCQVIVRMISGHECHIVSIKDADKPIFGDAFLWGCALIVNKRIDNGVSRESQQRSIT